MTGICGACAHPKQWSGPSHFDYCLVGAMARHPSAQRDLPTWYSERYLIDDHDLAYEEKAGK